MKTFRKYFYSKGSFEELKREDVERKEFSPQSITDIFELERLSPKLIVIPWAVGIYQEFDLEPENYEEGLEVEERKESLNSFQNIMNMLSLLEIKMYSGKEDAINPSLIHVIYDREIIPDYRLIRDSFGNSFSRVAFSEFPNIPDFSSKTLESLEKLQVYFTELKTKISPDEFNKKLEESGKIIENSLDENKKLYGLTRGEYALLCLVKKTEKMKNELTSYLIRE